MENRVHRVGHVLHARSDRYFWSGSGLTSLKSFYHGTAEYQLGHGTERVDPSRYLLLNEGQPYSISIDSDRVVESFCVFFESGYAGRAAIDMTSREETLLDNPFEESFTSLEFLDKTYGHDDLVSPKLAALREKFPVHGTDVLWLDEQLDGLMRSMLVVHTEVLKSMQRVPASRAVTRREVFRRVAIANELIMAAYKQGVTLEDLSRASALSPNHLIRSYKQVFGCTPHQHIIHLRLGEAKRLLQHTSLSVLEVCQTVGFESLGSFSTAFRRVTGVSPAKYRTTG